MFYSINILSKCVFGIQEARTLIFKSGHEQVLLYIFQLRSTVYLELQESQLMLKSV